MINYKNVNDPHFGAESAFPKEDSEDEEQDEEEQDEEGNEGFEDETEDFEDEEQKSVSSKDLKATTPSLVTPQTPMTSRNDQIEEDEEETEEGSKLGEISEENKPKLQNVVSTVNLGCNLDLKKIMQHARNAEYNPKRFAAVIMRIREPKTTALIFASGKMVCTGAKSEEESKLAARRYARIIQKIGFQASFKEFKIQNIVGSCDIGFHLKLESLHNAHSKFSTYEPELFPGLIYRMIQPKIVLLIFVSGKIVLTGAKVREEITGAFEVILPLLLDFKKE